MKLEEIYRKCMNKELDIDKNETSDLLAMYNSVLLDKVDVYPQELSNVPQTDLDSHKINTLELKQYEDGSFRFYTVWDWRQTYLISTEAITAFKKFESVKSNMLNTYMVK